MCPAGKYSGFEAAQCLRCAAGEISVAGAILCTPCDAANGQTSNADNTECSFCLEDFFSDGGACQACPHHATCLEGTTKSTIDVLPGYWRNSIDTTRIRPCLAAAVCGGGVDIEAQCLENHDGPLCTGCGEGYALNRLDSTCLKCDGSATRESKWKVGLAAASVTVVATISFFAYRYVSLTKEFRDFKVIVTTGLLIVSNAREIGKIVLVYFQLVVAHVGGVLKIDWPDA